MTINGPAPIVLAFFLNAAIDQGVERHLRETGRLEAVRARFGGARPAGATRARCRAGHDGLGLGAARHVRATRWSTPRPTRASAPTCSRRVRGTVQADILKEDQAQNTCIFSTEFALKLMGDVQEWFVANEVANFYSVSISGYHIAEAGANPITQLAFTLANGFTYCEYYRARGMRDRRLRAELLVLLQQRPRRRVQRDRPRRAADLGDRDARALRRVASAARSSSTTSRPRAARCTRRRWRSTTSAPRCRRCSRSRTTATACTPTPTTRRSPRRPRSRCAARWRSS